MNKFSKDPKSHLISIEEFLENSDYLSDAKKNLWKGQAPEKCSLYYKFTSKYLVLLNYGWTTTNFGMDFKEKLEEIVVAIRDGKTEYELFETKRKQLIEERSKHRKSKKLNEQIETIEKTIKSLNEIFPPYEENDSAIELKGLDEYIVDTGCKMNGTIQGQKCVVFDVETNGVRKSSDDLLSISIYDPTTGLCYNRFLPLELQPTVLTTYIHGITDEDIKNESHITQEEMDELIEKFDLKNSILLSYSGGQGTFDRDFIVNYCKRHKVTGFEDLKFDNIKKYIPAAGFGTEGQLTKDNLCRLMGIEGVSDIHSGLNDCVLEWKLFDKIMNDKLFFIQEHLFRYHPEYIVPITYISMHPELKKYAGIELPQLVAAANNIFEFEFPKKVLKEIKKFPTNITGITLENAIDSMLNAKEQNNFDFLAKNKSYLEYIGSLDSRINKMPIITENDGTIKSLNHENDEYIKEVNNVTKIVMDNISPIVDFVKSNIFKNCDEIISQELVVSDDRKVLALCDLSSNESVLEIKTYGVLDENNNIEKRLCRQLYYQKKNRQPYVMSIMFETHFNDRTLERITDNIKVVIYKVTLEERKPEPRYITRELMDREYSALQHIIENPLISNAEIARLDGRTGTSVGRTINVLWNLGYITKEDNKRSTPWRVLKTDRTYTVKLRDID